jgi:hypothetical protein
MVMSCVLHKAFAYPKPNMTPRNAAAQKNFGGKTQKICVGWRAGITPYPSPSVPRGFLHNTPEGGRWGRSRYSIPEIQMKDIGWTFMHITIVTPFVADLQLFYLCFVYS